MFVRFESVEFELVDAGILFLLTTSLSSPLPALWMHYGDIILVTAAVILRGVERF